LPDGFEENDAYRGGKVQAANAWIWHRNFEAVVPVRTQEIFRKTARLTAKDETIIGVEVPVSVKLLGFRREVNEARLRQCFVERVEIFVTSELYFRPVVEAGALHGTIVHAKACNADDVQRHVGGSTQPCDVAGVRWNLRFDERDRKHQSYLYHETQKETTSFA
jgi:hypothetical protein